MCNYKGSKAKWVREIWTPITEYMHNKGVTIDYEKDVYVELFSGGFGLGASLPFKHRIANDINPYVASYLAQIQESTDWLLEPDLWTIDEKKYNYIKMQFENNTNLFSPAFMGYIGIYFSYGHSFFQGFNRSENPQKLARRAYKHALEDHKLLQGVQIINLNYKDVIIPPNSYVYCDPPYQGTSDYGYSFDFDEFIEYFIYLASLGHHVFLSEVNTEMPSEIIQIGQFKRPTRLGNGSKTRRKG